MGLLLHVLAMKLSTKQAILSELLNYILWPLLFVLNLSPFTSNEDRLVYRMIFNALAFILSTCNLLMKRQVKRPQLSRSHLSRSQSSSSPPSIVNSVVSTRSHKFPTLCENNQWIDSDDDYIMDTSPRLEVLPDPVREKRTESRECTPFTEISTRLSSMTLNFIRESTPTKLFFSRPKSQAPTMLSSAAITPSSKRIKSPFSSLKFHAISKQTMEITRLDHSNWPQTQLNDSPKKAPSLFSESSDGGVSREYNLRHRTIPSRASSTYSSTYMSTGTIKNPAMRSLLSTSSTISNVATVFTAYTILTR
ncbi:hypothetical protein M3Y97_00589200 [Aphelenchoides bicaudatus]|nr:hypothetical protein M3Y97_00589200 [Aphelenchoides bicaudatus]